MYINSPETRRIAAIAFPEWKGKKIEVRPFIGPMDLASGWSGGTRSDFVMINISTGATAEVPENGTIARRPVGELKSLPINCMLVEHTIFCGTDCGLTIYVNPENLNKFVTGGDDLGLDHHIVLTATANLKSSYAGISNYRFHEASRETGITAERWETAKSFLISNSYLNKAGAITDKGRNARKYNNLFEVKYKNNL
jgi:hypothetical protein